MFYSNVNNLSILLFLFLFFIGIVILIRIYKNTRNFISILFLLLSFLFILINLFGIKGGFNINIEKVKGGKIVFVLDVSKSMDTLDVVENKKETSRLNLSKNFINKYITENYNNSYGLIIFSGEAIETIPFTNDLGIYKTILFSVNNNNISKNGTNLNSVFENLNNYFQNENDGGTVVLFTDGGDDKIDINSNLLSNIEKKGVKISIVGVGTSKGGKIPISKDVNGNYIYKKYNGNNVFSIINTNVLKYISSKNYFEYIEYSDNDKYLNIDNFIHNNINLVSMEKNINYRTDYTRILIFTSFVFFIFFLIFDNILGRKK